MVESWATDQQALPNLYNFSYVKQTEESEVSPLLPPPSWQPGDRQGQL